MLRLYVHAKPGKERERTKFNLNIEVEKAKVQANQKIGDEASIIGSTLSVGEIKQAKGDDSNLKFEFTGNKLNTDGDPFGELKTLAESALELSKLLKLGQMPQEAKQDLQAIDRLN